MMTQLSSLERERASNIGQEALSAFYGSREGDLTSDCKQLELSLKNLLARNGFADLKVDTSPKLQASALDKVRRKSLNEKSDYAQRIIDGERPEKIITDLVRGRITCRFSDQIDLVAKLLEQHFEIDHTLSEDHRITNQPNEFGYAALHLICTPLNDGKLQVFFSDCKFEIQIRSSLMDIWGVVNWDIDYKPDREVPFEIQRRLASVSALFYLIDREFIGIREDVSVVKDANQNDYIELDCRLKLDKKTVSQLRKRQIQISDKHASLLIKIKEFLSALDVEKLGGIDSLDDGIAFYIMDRYEYRWMLDDETASRVDRLDIPDVFV
jgi:ppGpp synthetase/RelA/SpoT-type nucleotidyltranferase